MQRGPRSDTGDEGALGKQAWGECDAGKGVACRNLRPGLVGGPRAVVLDLGALVSVGLGAGLLLFLLGDGLGKALKAAQFKF
ncbi:hypothetical protein GALL_152080 [mine drainage metagenome]|uniref:Uncharacterized protein n=1 Tax=mine drainage metagenome TaxID=410659 RepID=A0A1J5S3S7_9ZZZZ